MRGFLRKLAAALKAATAAAVQVVLVPVRLASGAMSWVWEAVANRNMVDCGGPTEWEQIEADMAAEHPDLDAVAEAMRVLGAEARVAAKEMLAFGEVRSPVRSSIRNWIVLLDRADLEALVGAEDGAVGRHCAGVELLRNEFGETVRTPDAERDERHVRQRAQRRREFEESLKVKPAPKPEPVGGPAAPMLGLAA